MGKTKSTAGGLGATREGPSIVERVGEESIIDVVDEMRGGLGLSSAITKDEVLVSALKSGNLDALAPLIKLRVSASADQKIKDVSKMTPAELAKELTGIAALLESRSGNQ